MDFTSLNKDISFWTGTDTSSNSAFNTTSRTRSVNEWYRIVNQWIWDSDVVWQYDDTNYGTLPIAEQSLEGGTGNYELPSNAQRVMAVNVKDNDGNWVKLEHIDQSQIDVAYDEFKEDDGLPRYFDVIGNSLNLKPAPKAGDVTTTDGLQVHLSRGIEEFSTTSTTKEPGFVKDFHRILSLGPSLDYLTANDARTEKQNRVSGMINDYESRLRAYYGTRNQSVKNRIIPRELNGGSGSFNTSV